MKRHFIIDCCIGIILLCGCDARSPDVKEASDRISAYWLHTSASEEELPSERHRLLKELRESVLSVSNKTSRIVLARGFANKVNGIQLELKDGDFRGFERSVVKYKDCFDAARWLLADSGVDDKEYMEYLFCGMNKLRQACFAIPQTRRGEDESERDFMKRCYAVWSLMEDYDAEIGLCRRLVEPRIKRMQLDFQQEYHDRWLQFLQYSHGRRLRESMLFGTIRDIGRRRDEGEDAKNH